MSHHKKSEEASEPRENTNSLVGIVRSTIQDPIAQGLLADSGEFVAQDGGPLCIWEWPENNERYYCGAHAEEGLGGNHRYSVASVVKYSTVHKKFIEVASWRSNLIGLNQFAQILNHLGKTYNDALLAPECNKYDIVIGLLRFKHVYPNLYRWKCMDSFNGISNKLGWLTTTQSRSNLVAEFRELLNDGRLVIRSSNICLALEAFLFDEMEEDQSPLVHDEDLMAHMIAVHCAHEAEESSTIQKQNKQ